ncbi:MAG TPA: hypothetical protein VF783_13860 [Terriglobales bacterium]
MSEEKALTLPERAAVALGAAEHEKNLIALSTKYADLVEIKNNAARQQVHGAYMELKNTRVAIKKAGEVAREDANLFQRAVIAEVERLTAITSAEEARLEFLRDEYDLKVAKEKEAKAAAEKERVDGIRKRIAGFQDVLVVLVGADSETIKMSIEALEADQITLEAYMEFSGEAELAKIATLQKLGEMLTAQQAHEAEQARIAEERAALEAERRAQAERQRQIDLARALDEQLAREAREREQAKRLEEQAREDAERRAKMKAEEARLRAEREAEERRLAAERAELARQQAELAAAKAEQERIAREAREAAEAEERRKHEELEAAAQKAERERVEREREENRIARNAPQPTGGTWSVGEHGLTVVTTESIAGCPGTGHNDTEYYGGNLICESVWRPADAHLIAAAPAMLDALEHIVEYWNRDRNDEAMHNALWHIIETAESAISATRMPEVQPEAQAA